MITVSNRRRLNPGLEMPQANDHLDVSRLLSLITDTN